MSGLIGQPGTTPAQLKGSAASIVGQQRGFQMDAVRHQQDLVDQTLAYRHDQQAQLADQNAQVQQVAAAQTAAVATAPIPTGLAKDPSVHTATPLGDLSDPYLAQKKLLGN